MNPNSPPCLPGLRMVSCVASHFPPKVFSPQPFIINDKGLQRISISKQKRSLQVPRVGSSYSRIIFIPNSSLLFCAYLAEILLMWIRSFISTHNSLGMREYTIFDACDRLSLPISVFLLVQLAGCSALFPHSSHYHLMNLFRAGCFAPWSHCINVLPVFSVKTISLSPL
ncbi:hypothetical protein J3A83DRAFT_1140869 [Scleroderma citrinum]